MCVGNRAARMMVRGVGGSVDCHDSRSRSRLKADRDYQSLLRWMSCEPGGGWPPFLPVNRDYIPPAASVKRPTKSDWGDATENGVLVNQTGLFWTRVQTAMWARLTPCGMWGKRCAGRQISVMRWHALEHRERENPVWDDENGWSWGECDVLG